LIFEKAGVLTFRDEGELCQAAAAFATQPIPQGKRVGIITNTGGPAVIATDVFVDAGLKIPPLPAPMAASLKETLYPEASVNNPIDVLATGNAAHYRACMDAMMNDDQFDCIYVNFVTPFFVDTDSIAKEIVEVNKAQKKPIICNLMTDKNQWTETVRILKEGGVPCFSLPGEAARALSAMARYHTIRTRNIGEPTLFDDVDKAQARMIITQAQAAGCKNLAAADVYSILGAYKVRMAAWQIANNVDDAIDAANQIGMPVVVKIDDETIEHKSDQGAVAINLRNAPAVRNAVEEMSNRLEIEDNKFLIQRYLPGGKELIVGAKAEEGLGHLIMFGLGGIYVEILKDVIFKLTPVTALEAGEMLTSIKAAALLQGVRGENAIYKEGVIDVILRLSQLLSDLPEIQELDLNPIIAYEDQAFVVDARIRIS